MKIDVLFSGCARTEMMDKTLTSFRRHVRCRDGFRTILIEDKVDDQKRQDTGRDWIEKHRNEFDKVVLLQEKAGPYHQFQCAVKQVESPMFFKMDDDAEFFVNIDVDVMISIMDSVPDLAELILRRNSHREVNPVVLELPESDIILNDFFSISFGLYRTEYIRRLMDDIGWDTETHETRTLTPAAKRLKMKCAIFGRDVIHYLHVGGEMGFDKGGWK